MSEATEDGMTEPAPQPGHGLGHDPEAASASRRLLDRIPAQWRTRQTGMIAGAAVAILALATILGVTLGGSGSPTQTAASTPETSAATVSAANVPSASNCEEAAVDRMKQAVWDHSSYTVDGDGYATLHVDSDATTVALTEVVGLGVAGGILECVGVERSVVVDRMSNALSRVTAGMERIILQQEPGE